MFQSGREMGSCSNKTATGMRASGIHQVSLTEQAAPPRDEDAEKREADHGDGDGGDAPEFDVVQFEIGVGVAAEEEAVFDRNAGIVGGLADLHPALLNGCGNR